MLTNYHFCPQGCSHFPTEALQSKEFNSKKCVPCLAKIKFMSILNLNIESLFQKSKSNKVVVMFLHFKDID